MKNSGTKSNDSTNNICIIQIKCQKAQSDNDGMEKNSTKKSRIIRENSDNESHVSLDMKSENTTKNNCSLQKQSNNQCDDKKTMKLIQVQYHWEHMEHDDMGYPQYNVNEDEHLGLFDNIQDAWDFVSKRVEKYHATYYNYSFNIVTVNPEIDSVEPCWKETQALQEHIRKVEDEKMRILNEKTVGFRCSECKRILKMQSNVGNLKTEHARNKHIDGASWGHVTWTRVLKKEVKKDE